MFFDLHLISFWIIILYLCLEKKVNNKWWKLFLLNFLRSNFLFGVVSAALINHLLFIKMKLWQNWENHLQRAHLRGKGIRVGNEEFLIFFFIKKKNWLDTTLFIKECEVFFFSKLQLEYSTSFFRSCWNLKNFFSQCFFLFFIKKKSSIRFAF